MTLELCVVHTRIYNLSRMFFDICVLYIIYLPVAWISPKLHAPSFACFTLLDICMVYTFSMHVLSDSMHVLFLYDAYFISRPYTYLAQEVV